MANITGTNATQVLNGTPDPDTIQGLGGSDQIGGSGGADVISGGDGADTILGGDGDDTIYGHSTADLSPNSADITATLLANVGSAAVFVTGAPGDNGFVYALKKDAGEVIRINISTGAQTSFLNIPDAEFAKGGERGVLGLAFHPDYATNGRFFVYLTNPSGDIELREYARSAGSPPTASATVVQTIITIPHPEFANHNGGSLAFGPDGFLYIATGDGGGANDRDGNAQNINSLLGKILRIDVDGDDFPADATRNYAIPSDNPFEGATPGADEIWDLGLRNPWRISFDSLTGDLYIGDVGQAAREEVDFEPAGSPGGVNYGWDFREGLIQGPSAPPSPPIDFTDPVFEYTHALGNSITGGYAYRGPAAGLQGAYFFADFISGRLFSLRVVDGVAEDALERTAQVTGANLQQIASFGTDNAGNLYVVSLSGEIHRLSPGVAAGDGADAMDGGAGNDRLHGGWGNDRLTGGVGNDSLAGGVGADFMRGGAGDDLYGVDNAGDTVDEGAGGSGGTDTVRSSISFSLANSGHVLGLLERLTLLGTANINGTGNAAGNTLIGNSGLNTLSGGGGADVMYGLGGGDAYVVDNAGDTVNEAVAGSSGIDTVRSSISFSLVNSARVLGVLERLSLLGSANINGTGNALGNSLIGNAGINTLNGGDGADSLFGVAGNDVLLGGAGNDGLVGGLGNDTMSGGAGSDSFVFDAPLGNVDRITDFNVAADTIRLENVVFTAIAGTGVLTAAQFARNTTGLAQDPSDRIVYETDTGRVFYDSNGSAAGGSIQFAVLAPNLGIINADFAVI